MTKKHWLLLVIAIFIVGCITLGMRCPPMVIQVGWLDTIDAIYRDELKREPDNTGRASYLTHIIGDGWDDSKIRNDVKASAEWRQKHPPIPPITNQLHVLNGSFVTEDGNLWAWRGWSAFRLFERFLNGEDIGLFLDTARTHGATILRIFGMYAGGIGHFIPSEHPNYYDKLDQFLDVVAANGLRVELVVFADVPAAMPSGSDQRLHYARIERIAQRHANTVVEVANEAFKNGIEPNQFWPIANVPTAKSSKPEDEGFYALWPGGYTTVHPDRQELNDGLDLDGKWRWVRHQWEAREGPQPVIVDEPKGFSDIFINARRDNSPERAHTAAIVGALIGGFTAHSDALIQAKLPTPGGKESACLDAVSEAWLSLPVDAAQGHDTRAGLGDAPVVLDDAHALRVYCRINGNRALCAIVHPIGYTPVAQNGWKIVRRISDDFVELTK